MRVLLAGLLVCSLPAAADPAPDVSKMASDDCARAHKLGKTCVLSITDEGPIEGRVPTVGDKPIVGLPTGTHDSLIRIRWHFIPEILKTAEDL
jgi:hypothetical protein